MYSRKLCLSRALCFERKMKGKMKLNSEHVFGLATLEVNAIWRMPFFLILPKYNSIRIQ